MRYRWIFARGDAARCAELAQDATLSRLLAACLYHRGAEGGAWISDFLQPRLRQMRDPFELPDMEAAVERLMEARSEGQLVAIFGDYDVDGVTASALMREVLRGLGWRCEVYLPSRVGEGYGLSAPGVRRCLELFPARLLLAVDCGSTSGPIIQELKDAGVDTVVLDHHQMPEALPPARAVVNPQRLAEGSPYRALCSAGLAFKLAHALVKRGRELNWESAHSMDLREVLDLAALGTIADVVPLVGENRILAAAGLDRLQRSMRPGIRALKEVAGIQVRIGVHEVAFQLAPRLNAAGRLENAERALELLSAETMERARPLAEDLDRVNRERREVEGKMAEEVCSLVGTRFDSSCFVITEAEPQWHIGVVGIVASRVLRQFYRPTIILGGDGEDLRGSGRSIAGFDLAAALRECGDLLVKHGGHAMAAGLSIRPDKLLQFQERMNAIGEQQLQGQDLRPVLTLDAEVRLDELNHTVVSGLRRLEPHGQGNPSVQVVARDLKLRYPPRWFGKKNQHLKVWVTDGTAIQEAVWWNAPAAVPFEPGFSLACTPSIVEYEREQRVQLRVLDWAGPGEEGSMA